MTYFASPVAFLEAGRRLLLRRETPTFLTFSQKTCNLFVLSLEPIVTIAFTMRPSRKGDGRYGKTNVDQTRQGGGHLQCDG